MSNQCEIIFKERRKYWLSTNEFHRKLTMSLLHKNKIVSKIKGSEIEKFRGMILDLKWGEGAHVSGPHVVRG